MFDKILLKLDQTITSIFSEWDVYTTTMATGLIAFVAYQLITSRDADAHPMLLARQSQASPVRQPGASAVYRSHSNPHGAPLASGLNIKDPGQPKWTRGRDGDLKDIWRRVVLGRIDQEGKATGEVGKLMTLLGSENIIHHELSDITRHINIIGEHIKQNGGTRVAIYLPNSVEFLAGLFAYTIVLQLKESKADTIIAAVGSFAFDDVAKKYSALHQVIWVVDEGSRHLDWNEVPSGTGGALNVSTWQDIIQDQDPKAGTELPPVEKKRECKTVIAFWPSGELVEFTHANLIAGMAGQLSSVPTTQRITSADLFLSVDSISTIYALVMTLSALYSNASVALNSVAGRTSDLTLATQGVAPTIIVASAETLAKVHSEAKAKLSSSFYRIVHWFQTRSLVQNGVMPIATMFSRLYDSLRPVIGNNPGKLRLIYVSEQTGVESTPLSAEMLSDLRIYTGSRIIYALTAPEVAGAITQTGLYDYRVDEGGEKYSHFGAPVTSVEVFFKDTQGHKTTDERAAGQIVAKGPAVVGGETVLPISGKMKQDNTLALL